MLTMYNFLLTNLQFYAAAAPDISGPNCSKSFLTFKTWFYYLPQSSFSTDCSITKFQALGSNSGFLLIALAIIDDLIRVAGLVAIGYVIWGGLQYITSQGSPDMTKKAQQTIINALIGLVLAVVAASLVSFIGVRLSA